MNGGIATVHIAIPGADLRTKKIGRPKKDKTYSEKVMTYLRPETMRDVRIIAEGNATSVSELVRQAVQAYVVDQRYIADLPVDRTQEKGVNTFMEYLEGGDSWKRDQ